MAVDVPAARGPVSGWVAQALTEGSVASLPALPDPPVSDSDDLQLALWMLYEVHYRGFRKVRDAEWDPELIRLRGQLESRFEAELRQAVADVVARQPMGDMGEILLDMAAAAKGPSVASFLQREATWDQMADYIRERSVQQLKESDPQSFVLARLDGQAKVALAEVQYDEYGAGRTARLHSSLYADTMRAASLNPRYGAYLEQVSAVSLASANVMSMFALNRRLRGAAMGHLAAFEATSSLPCRKISIGLDRLGFPPVARVYFDEHVEADAVHEQVAARDICGALVAEDPDLREDVLFGAAVCLYMDERVGTWLLDRWAVAS